MLTVYGYSGIFAENYETISIQREDGGSIALTKIFEELEDECLGRYNVEIRSPSGNGLSFSINDETLDLLIEGFEIIRDLEPSEEEDEDGQ